MPPENQPGSTQDPNPSDPSSIPPNPTSQSEASEIDKLIQATLGEAERRNAAAIQRIRELEDQLHKQNNTPPVKEEPATKEQFYNDPIGTMQHLIDRSMAPVNAAAQQLAADRKYGELKQQYRQYPGFDKLEGYIDNIMRGQEPTHENMQIAVQRAVGLFYLNGGGKTDPTPPKTLDNQPTDKTPPAPTNRPLDPQAHLRPSVTTTNKDTTPSHRTLNELEKRLAREAGMTEERYLQLIDARNEVTAFRKPEKK